MIKFKDILPTIFESSKYIGSCVDVDSRSKAPVCDIFSDATAMAQKIGNPDEDNWGDSKELTETHFFRYIDRSVVPSNSIKGEHSYHYIAKDNSGKEMSPKESAIFFIYNSDYDIHYFFRK